MTMTIAKTDNVTDGSANGSGSAGAEDGTEGAVDTIGARIVAAAADAIVDGGFGAATTEHIARAAKTSKRAIYQRYPNRAALFEQVMAHLCATAGEGVTTSSDSLPDGLQDQLEETGLAVLVRFAEPRVQRVLTAAIGATAVFPDALDVFWRSGPGVAVEALTAVLEKAHAAGDVRLDDPATAARSFILECCGPLVLGQLFEPGARADDRTLRSIARTTAIRSIERWR